MKYFNDISSFRKDFYRAVSLIWNAGKGLLLLNLLLLVLQAVLPIASLYYIKLLVDELVAGAGKGDLSMIYPGITGFAVVQFLLAVVVQVAQYVYTLQLQRVHNYLAEQVLKKAVAVDLEYYENPEYHDTLHMAQLRSEYQAPVLLNIVNGLVLNSCSLLFLIGFFLQLQWFYALIFVSVSIPLACVKWYYGYRLFKLEKKYITMEREASYYHNVLTGVSFAKEVRSFGFGKAFVGRYRQIRETIFKQKDGLNRRFTLLSLLAQVVEVAVMIFIFMRLADNAWKGLLSVGVFVIYLQGFQRLQSASKNFLESLVQIFQQRLFLKDIFSFLDIEPKVKKGEAPFPALQKGLAVEHVSFTYPQTGREVLHDVSLQCRPGQIIAIVGENGSGKSTLVKLLARMYDVRQGRITIDGVDVGHLQDEQHRLNTIFLFQDFEKYFLTIGENIALADELQVNDAEVKNAAVNATADDFISLLAEQYHTRLGRTFQRAEQLSGGQWQKLAMARAFYKRAKLIVLDEPTSQIDAVAEHKILENLRRHAQDKMVILISHRMYNLKMAGTIYVMRDGKIAESGTYDELISRQGIFREMYNKQQL